MTASGFMKYISVTIPPSSELLRPALSSAMVELIPAEQMYLL